MALIDPSGRKIDYLRLSVTDRCNLRCTYCMPARGVTKLAHGDVLSYEDLYRVACAAVATGVEKIRVTGGEPLVRKGIIGFLERLAAIPGLKRLVLTTNGILLEEMAADLRAAGLESLNLSLDSLRPDTFARITRGGDISRVLAGIDAAARAGFPFIKINVVVMRGVNDREILDFAALTLDRPYRVRFIEYMPTLGDDGQESLLVPGYELLDLLSRRFSLERAEKEIMAGPASYYRIAGAAGTIGIISPVSCHFCMECNRIRVTSTGMAKSCLFASGALDLKPVLRMNDDLALQQAVESVVSAKPARHNLGSAEPGHSPVVMSQVGG